jgi:hypothetical protein
VILEFNELKRERKRLHNGETVFASEKASTLRVHQAGNAKRLKEATGVYEHELRVELALIEEYDSLVELRDGKKSKKTKTSSEALAFHIVDVADSDVSMRLRLKLNKLPTALSTSTSSRSKLRSNRREPRIESALAVNPSRSVAPLNRPDFSRRPPWWRRRAAAAAGGGLGRQVGSTVGGLPGKATLQR